MKVQSIKKYFISNQFNYVAFPTILDVVDESKNYYSFFFDNFDFNSFGIWLWTKTISECRRTFENIVLTVSTINLSLIDFNLIGFHIKSWNWILDDSNQFFKEEKD